jgi:hypothetical protein
LQAGVWLTEQLSIFDLVALGSATTCGEKTSTKIPMEVQKPQVLKPRARILTISLLSWHLRSLLKRGMKQGDATNVILSSAKSSRKNRSR